MSNDFTVERRVGLAEVDVAVVKENMKFFDKSFSNINDKLDAFALAQASTNEELSKIRRKMDILTVAGVVLWALVLFFKEPIFRLIGL